MDVHRQTRASANLCRGLDHLDTPACEASHLGVCLDSLDQIAISLGGSHRGVDIDAVRTVQRRVIMPFEPSYQVSGEEGDDATARRFDAKGPEPGQGHATRTTLVHQGRNPRLNPAQVGIEAKSAGDVLVNMSVRVD